MRPTRLELEGFISFRERTEIDFSKLDLFGVTGPTGAGKTSLIDSIIFALYGKTPRLGEKAVQELITQGSDQMTVLLEFRSGIRTYRVLRIVKRRGAGRVQIERLDGVEWTALSASSRGIKEQIEDIVGLDFDGFTRTVVLPQGQFDRFLRGDGSARRKILSDLLGLDMYEQMMKRANEIARDSKRQADILTEVIEQQFGSVSNEAIALKETALHAARKDRQTAARDLAKLDKALPSYIEFQRLNTELSKQSAERDRIESLLRKAAGAVSDSRRAIERLEVEAATIIYDSGKHLELKTLLPIVKRCGELQDRIRAIETRLAAEKKTLADASTAAVTAQKKWEAALAAQGSAKVAAEKAASDWQTFRLQFGTPDRLLQATREADALVQSWAACSALESQIAERKKELARAASELEKLESREAQASQRLVESRAALDRLRHLHAAAGLKVHLQAGEPCPVCEQVVAQLPGNRKAHPDLDNAVADLASEERARELLRVAIGRKRQFVQETLPAQIASDVQRLATLETSIESVETHLKQLAGTRAFKKDPVAAMKAKAAEAKDSEANAANAETLLRASTDQEAAARQLGQQAEAKRSLALQIVSSTERELDERRAELQNLPGKDADAPSLLKADAELEKARARREAIEKDLAAARRVADKAEVDERGASERLALCRANVEVLHARFELLEAQLGELAAADELERRRAAAQKRVSETDGLMSTLTAERDALRQRAEESAELREKVTTLANTGEVHSRLASLLRTDQFVAWILKDAFARLAYEGSRQLEQLSNGRYTFAADSDDFSVCDRWNAGERRSVHTLSGGESFLASLSLALALSRSLPEFAGEPQRARLDSLFLDEGFSTLDAETMNTVLEAVELLQADGRLVGVVSHSAELAERLPGRIEVAKSASGSRVAIK